MNKNNRHVSINIKAKRRHSKKKNQSGEDVQIRYKNGNVYTGGVKITTDQLTYDGEVNSENIPHGQGQITHNDGSSYKGNWINGRKNGRGIFVYKNGNTYDGEWIDDRMNGEGVMIWSEQSGNPRLLYRGHYANHRPHGEGYMEWRNGNKYTGEFNKGSYHGQGKIEYFHGSQYEGEWKNDRKEGNGVMTYSIDTPRISYNGEWVDSKEQGHGILYNRDHSKYEGNFLNGSPDGKGIYEDEDRTIEGKWSDGPATEVKVKWKKAIKDLPFIYYSDDEFDNDDDES